jgi:Transposase IS66 family
VGGINQTTNIPCNPWYTIYQTTRAKNRLSVLGVLQNTQELGYLINEVTYEVLKRFKLPTKWLNRLQLFPPAQRLSGSQLDAQLEQRLPRLNPQSRTRIQEAAAIAYYRQQSSMPVIQTLVCDDAPQFKDLTEGLMLCWIHEARHYKKLTPVVAVHQQALEKFLKQLWQYYRQLLDYRMAPSALQAQELAAEFERLVSEKSGYQQLDERKQLTRAKASELLLVLEHPELPLHNNAAELAARTMVQRRNISYATQSEQGTQAWDLFMSLVATARKLGISFFEYVGDRISEMGKIPALGQMIEERAASNPLGGSGGLE